MNKTQLISVLAARCEMQKSMAEQVVREIFCPTDGLFAKALAKGEEVIFQGFGSFRIRKRGARTIKSPFDGKMIKVPARKVVTFHPGKGLKDLKMRKR